MCNIMRFIQFCSYIDCSIRVYQVTHLVQIIIYMVKHYFELGPCMQAAVAAFVYVLLVECMHGIVGRASIIIACKAIVTLN